MKATTELTIRKIPAALARIGRITAIAAVSIFLAYVFLFLPAYESILILNGSDRYGLTGMFYFVIFDLIILVSLIIYGIEKVLNILSHKNQVRIARLEKEICDENN